MVAQHLITNARVAGAACAKRFLDAFEETNKNPNSEQREALRASWDIFFAAQHVVWTEAELIEAWRDSAELTFLERMKFYALRRSSGPVA